MVKEHAAAGGIRRYAAYRVSPVNQRLPADAQGHEENFVALYMHTMLVQEQVVGAGERRSRPREVRCQALRRGNAEIWKHGSCTAVYECNAG